MLTQVDGPLPLILVAHRARDTVELLKTLLEHEGYTVLCAYNGRAALNLARQHHPILLLLDQALPLIDGLELCRTLRQDDDQSAIFILSDRLDELGKLLAFTAGADDCLVLPFHPRELLARMKAILRRINLHEGGEPHVLHCGQIELDAEQRQVRVFGEVIALTGLEYELLHLLLRYPGRAFSRTQLLELTPGFQHNAPFDRAVDIHISNLRRKLGHVMESDAPIETVRGIGYRLNMPVTASPASAAPAPAKQEQLALAAFQHVPSPLLVLAADRTVVLYNEAARQLCGWSADQVIGQVKCYSLLACHDEHGKMLCQQDCILHSGLLSTYKEHTTHYSIILKDGREVTATAHYSNLGEPGHKNGYVLLALEPEPVEK